MKNRKLQIFGLTRVMNESRIIKETLDHLSEFCSGGIFVYDDCSTDNTVELCKNHPKVILVIEGKYWDSDREKAEFENRQSLLTEAQKFANENDWFVYIDADERIEFDWNSIAGFNENAAAVRMKLFDFYITPEDIYKKYAERQFIGPEFREIITAFKNSPLIRYDQPDQREVTVDTNGIIINQGFVKHYGKSISVEQWEETCNYYVDHFPKYAEKWEKRKGKAVHYGFSDFGNKLIKWSEKEILGFPLELHNLNSPTLKILISTHHLIDFTGTEVYTLNLVKQLKILGHNVFVYSHYVDEKLKKEFDLLKVPLVEHLEAFKDYKFDVAHIHHNINAIEVRKSFPTLPMVFVSHGVVSFLEQPPKIDLNIQSFIAVSEEVKENLLMYGISSERIKIFRNIFDSDKFQMHAPIGVKPKKALVISGKIDEITSESICTACEKLGIEVKFIGGKNGNLSQDKVFEMINEADLVFSLGRGAVEAMLLRRAVIVLDYQCADGLVTSENFYEILKHNFSGRRFGKYFSVDELVAEIGKCNPEEINKVYQLAQDVFSVDKIIGEIVETYFCAINTDEPFT